MENQASGLGVDQNFVADEEQEITDKSTEQLKEHPIKDHLLDPDDVCRQLESVNLTEEDTEILLQDALQLNKILKAHLLKQEGCPKKSKKGSTPDGKKLKKVSSSGGDLPPINSKRGLSAAQMKIRQSPQMVRENKNTALSRPMLNGEVSKPTRSKTASSTSLRKRSKSAESNKKEWSDRW